MKLNPPTLPIKTPFNMTKYRENLFRLWLLWFSLLPATAETTAIDDFSSLNLTGGSGDWIGNWTNAVSGGTISTSAATGALVATRAGTGAGNVGSVSRQFTANTSDILTISFDFTIGSFPTVGGTAVYKIVSSCMAAIPVRGALLLRTDG